MNTPDSDIDFQQVANILDTTYCNAGIMDDYDELIFDAIISDDSTDRFSAVDYHKSVLEGLRFINKYDKDRQNNPYKLENFHADFVEACEQCGCPELIFEL